MRTTAFCGASALIFLVSTVQAKHGVHEHLEAIHRRHRLEREAAREANETLVKRGTCQFPSDAGLVPVTPGSGNGGWAFAPDQQCTVNRYCPYACPSGQVSMQWDPSVTSYSYPGSRNGGLLCNSDGTVSKPFPNKPYCQQTASNIGVQNNVGQNVAVCQTVLPGDEDMLIPTDVSSWSALAVPDTSYWAGTAAHYYVNPPGVSSADGCVWGSSAKPHGNWAPYVIGANADASGQTFIKLGWNPIYLEAATPFRNEMPTWGVKIDCPNGGCNGLPCSIDPTQNKVNDMIGSASDGAGGGAFCVVTVSKGSSANFVVFGSGDSQSSNQGGQFYQSSSSAPASSSTTSESSTTTSSVQSSTTTSSSSTEAWSTTASYNTTSTTMELGPSDQPHYQLFNTSTPAEPTNSANVAPKPTQGNTKVAQQSNGASSIGVSCVLAIVGFAMALL